MLYFMVHVSMSVDLAGKKRKQKKGLHLVVLIVTRIQNAISRQLREQQ